VRKRTTCAGLIVLLGAGLLVSACGTSGSLPVRSNASSTIESSPSEVATITSDTPTDTPTPTPTATATVTQTFTPPPPTPTPTFTAVEPPTPVPATTTSTQSNSSSGGVPAWVWWLLGAIAVALAIAIPLIVVSRRRGAWASAFSSATEEAAWFARTLIAQLQQEPSVEQVAGGWRIARARVVAVEDSLTGLVSTAPGETEAARARTLRDAVRNSRDRLDALVQPGGSAATSAELATAASTLEGALTAISPDAPPAASV
jgi:hypothetical protein